jgi:diadenosine tetraphosphate (Ap4A) HIT family hydrolase
MANQSDWAIRVAGNDCPFDMPRANIADLLFAVCQLSISTLYLERIQTYRGHCVLVFDPRHVTRIDELSTEEWHSMSEDIHRAEKTLIEVFQPDHINIASLGQVIPHLHWHIIPRYIGDPQWGGPIWTTPPEDMQKLYLQENEYEQLADEIRGRMLNSST